MVSLARSIISLASDFGLLANFEDCCGVTRPQWVNSSCSLAPGKFEWNFRYLILQIISVIDGWGICCELALRWMSLDLTDDKSTLVQVMAWCRQATSHYLSQCWRRSLSPYGVTRPQWVNQRWSVGAYDIIAGLAPSHNQYQDQLTLCGLVMPYGIWDCG